MLIFGATGAVGTMAVQFAAQRGARVLATATGKAAARPDSRRSAPTPLSTPATVRSPNGCGKRRQPASTRSWRWPVAKNLNAALISCALADALAHPNGIEPVPRPRKNLRVKSYDAVAEPKAFAKLSRTSAPKSRSACRLPQPTRWAKPHKRHRRLDKGHVIGRSGVAHRRACLGCAS